MYKTKIKMIKMHKNCDMLMEFYVAVNMHRLILYESKGNNSQKD